jgi:hypothetical protein
MNKKDTIQQKIDEAMSSMDDAQRATPKPFLLTRIMARMNAAKETSWEKAGRLISRPAFAIAGLGALIALNILVLTLNHRSATNSANEQTSFVTTGDFSAANATINDIENPEP